MSFADKISIQIKVVPKSSRNFIGRIGIDGLLRIYVTAVPENNKANEAVITLLCKTLKMSKSCICIVKGKCARKKKIELSVFNDDEKAKIQNLLKKDK
jgi:uncharacterized protein